VGRNQEEEQTCIFTIIYPRLEIGDISGGVLQVSSEITNIGDADASDVEWSISIDGGILIAGKEAEGTITTLEPGDTEVVINKPVLGLGRVEIIVTASADDVEEATKTVDGFVFFFFVIIT